MSQTRRFRSKVLISVVLGILFPHSPFYRPVQVEDLDAALAKAERLDGKIILPQAKCRAAGLLKTPMELLTTFVAQNYALT